MLTEILGDLLAGLGLFFIGIRLVGDNTKQMTGRRFRVWVARLTQNSFLAGVWGIISGALMQSTTAVTFVVISLVSAGLIKVRRAMPIITWSNLGNSLLVFLAVLDLRLVALYMLGFTGACYYFQLDRSARYRHMVGGLLGIGMLFLGLIFMKAGAAPLKEISWFTQFLAYTKNSYLLAFIVGGFLTFIAQSSTTVSIVAISLAKVGLLGWEQTMMIVYGSNLGVGVSTWFMASNLAGTSKQLAVFQALFKLAGALVLVPLFYLETLGHLPLVYAFVSRLQNDLGHQMALVFLLFQVVSALSVCFLFTPVYRLLERLSPPTHEEVLSKPQFIYDQALNEPETAVELVAQEQLRMARHLPQMLDCVREETRDTCSVDANAIYQATASVLKQVEGFTTDLLDQNHSRGSLERVVRLQSRNSQLFALNDSVQSLVKLAETTRRSSNLASLCNRIVEGMHLLLLTAVDTLETPDAANREILQKLTDDRGDLVDRIRRTVLRNEPVLEAADQQTLFNLTSLFERIVWQLRRLEATLEDEATAEIAL